MSINDPQNEGKPFKRALKKIRDYQTSRETDGSGNTSPDKVVCDHCGEIISLDGIYITLSEAICEKIFDEMLCPTCNCYNTISFQISINTKSTY